MKKSIAAAATALAAAAQVSLAVAQTPRPQVVSPEVTADRRIILRLYAPGAQQVVANGELDGKPHPLTKGANGVWTATIGPLDPDIYTYAFNVDGITTLDPQNARNGGARSLRASGGARRDREP